MKTNELLKLYFDRKKKASRGFSLRSLAVRLEISASFLSQVLNGKKSLPPDLLPRLAKALDIEPELLAKPKKTTEKTIDPKRAVDNWSLASVEATQILRNWYYVPILELTTLQDFDGEASTISRRLGLSVTTTDIALRELQSLGLIELKNGRYRKSVDKIRITSSKSLSVIRKFHDEMLEQSQDRLRNANSEEDFQKRLITGITISADPEKIQQAKVRLADFLHELAGELAADPGSEVYHLAAQLFPLTKA